VPISMRSLRAGGRKRWGTPRRIAGVGRPSFRSELAVSFPP
jgi:hypothetical protein